MAFADLGQLVAVPGGSRDIGQCDKLFGGDAFFGGFDQSEISVGYAAVFSLIAGVSSCELGIAENTRESMAPVLLGLVLQSFGWGGLAYHIPSISLLGLVLSQREYSYSEEVDGVSHPSRLTKSTLGVDPCLLLAIKAFSARNNGKDDDSISLLHILYFRANIVYKPDSLVAHDITLFHRGVQVTGIWPGKVPLAKLQSCIGTISSTHTYASQIRRQCSG